MFILGFLVPNPDLRLLNQGSQSVDLPPSMVYLQQQRGAPDYAFQNITYDKLLTKCAVFCLWNHGGVLQVNRIR